MVAASPLGLPQRGLRLIKRQLLRESSAFLISDLRRRRLTRIKVLQGRRSDRASLPPIETSAPNGICSRFRNKIVKIAICRPGRQ